jgi:uncharacterized membrane protein YfcA
MPSDLVGFLFLENNSILVLIVVLAMFIRSAFGFGDAIFAIPLIGLFVDRFNEGVAVLAAVGSSMSLVICLMQITQLEWRGLGRLLIPAAIGMPLGIYGLTSLPQSLNMIALGSLVVCVACRP